MPVSPTNALANPQATGRARESSEHGQLGRDAFMKLLVTQLQHQDPLDPMNPREMVTQLSELSSVEELVSIENRMGVLEVGIAALANTQVAGIVGKTITAEGGTLNLNSRGAASAVVTLEGRAETMDVEIRDAQGQLVRTLSLNDVRPGGHAVQWDERAAPHLHGPPRLLQPGIRGLRRRRCASLLPRAQAQRPPWPWARPHRQPPPAPARKNLKNRRFTKKIGYR